MIDFGKAELEEMELLDWDAAIDPSPKRPSGSIIVTLKPRKAPRIRKLIQRLREALGI